MRVLGIIPARGGSKGVPGKNIRKFEGKPLISYAIETGKKSKFLSELVVNTEDEEISRISEEYNCRVITRPVEFASDTSNVVETVLDTLQKFEAENFFFDAVLLLQPTAPLRTAKDIDNAIKMLESEGTDAVISMVSVGDHHPARMYRMKDNKAVSEMPEFENTRRQDLPEKYIRNGCIYLVRTEILKKEKTFMPKSKAVYVMDAEWAVNIDTEMDVLILNALIKKWNNLSQ
ncbi:acylneuraminate cytidylyltransferase family protein [Salegentibacter sp. F188]|uniref:Acylneuraminate cytidylyltransferase family protein n=1 Tax=Autumnicola patrickiae TaxID=3075591 RepID=A0ABU3DXY7_9FLAO|nr:acylneuraminate cytidylyltransferase family protein [Salegentibacter sp. F188]MDT0688595.1 acylneuraminate cytidylyltransferase family protein [Salegentibacter sp. F188]